MLAQREAEKRERIEALAARARTELEGGEGETAARFIELYYRWVDPRDVVARAPQDLYGAALAHWHLARRRRPGETRIRIYNPDFEEHGWESTHTVVEAVLEDMPFIVDSLRMELARHGFAVHVVIHPVLRVRRDGEGVLEAVLGEGGDGEGQAEAVTHIEVDRCVDPDVLMALERDLLRVLGDVRAAVEDWGAMRARLRETADGIDPARLPLDPAQVEEDRAFLRWLAEDHFVFLGSRDYVLESTAHGDTLRVVPGSGLGILREDPAEGISTSFSLLPPAVQRLARVPQLLILTKGNARATVHRPTHIDYVGIKRFDEAGRVVGERRFLGLYTSAAYHASPWQVPLLRRKVQAVLERAGLDPRSHDGKALRHILETYPRDELIQAPVEQLYDIALGILHLQERQQVRLFVRPDPYQRFVSCLVYVPRDAYHTGVRRQMVEILRRAWDGTDVEFTVEISESALARVHFVVRTAPGGIPEVDPEAVERRLAEAARTWEERLREALVERFGEGRGVRLFRRWGGAFPAGYREHYDGRVAAHDIEHMEALGPRRRLGMHLYRPLDAPSGALRFKLYSLGGPVPLAQALPVLEHMGVRVVFEHPYKLQPEGREVTWIHNFGLHHDDDEALMAEDLRERFQEAFARVWAGEADDDAFNRLVLAARLDWREVALLRGIARYLRQLGLHFSHSYMASALADNPGIARRLVQLFHVRLDPAREGEREARAERWAAQIRQAIDQVASLDQDRILREFLHVVLAVLRTNYYRLAAEGRTGDALALKIDTSRLETAPEPRPAFEIFVYATRVEGVHLRGGRVARGGIRWSDRLEDYRTEILGLMKAQQVKNAVIVPVGAKGGFVVKRMPAEGGREARAAEVEACYTGFIRALLDVTDNIVDGEVVAPPHVVRHDGDDPYLVVAADKGTATFSDLANRVAAEYGFWLGDAFASGGSVGYDHKKLGITARGAWEGVKRHFRELGLDIQSQDFTVVGIGDMGGDVFGNGMLLSRHIRLVAAFNHQHIFLDPDPDPEASFRERERLFRTPHATWADYDPACLSEGGGVFARSQKWIPLSEPVRRRLGVEAERMTPNELIRAILCAPVDLLWNGGIGTFVRASWERDADVGDRANDAVRVSAAQLRCRVVGEGGNLGLTQAARVEFALRGGRINTDFVDNSGGVDCSDHEVNIKILLDRAVAAGELTLKRRNALLMEVVEDVVARVLSHNYRRTQALSLAEARAAALLPEHARFIRALEREGLLDRALEGLPGDEALGERRAEGRGLTRPELAVLHAYAKIAVKRALLAEGVAEDPYLRRELADYFPEPLRGPFAAFMEQHPLRREIIVTHVVNGMVNRVGSTFVHRLHEETGAGAADVARAYTVVREVFALRPLWQEVEALDNRVAAAVQLEMLAATEDLAERAALWLLRNRPQPMSIEETVARYLDGVAALGAALPRALVPEDRRRHREAVRRLTRARVPAALAARVAALAHMDAALDLVEVCLASGHAMAFAAEAHFALGERLGLRWLRDQLEGLGVEGHWQRMAVATLREDLHRQQSALVTGMLAGCRERCRSARLVEAWLAHNEAALARWRSLLGDLRAAGALELAMFSVALRELRDLVERCRPLERLP
ncbi:NAD-glutamate dehydrogenase [Inmirania thermothiophila]|uniref:Glutamate dehydrogenase (NAD) n=1 Tax=Inmirania thermothiophila TaxID=1750597 RepID=A0A3N1Y896_9GAMM|nr:NAD-glutamate dehydrogenase [Inmirania thermothiophila]ROR35039.1 glutamate dehydrogenase (NAD) [Inmirania thermothiophila]